MGFLQNFPCSGLEFSPGGYVGGSFLGKRLVNAGVCSPVGGAGEALPTSAVSRSTKSHSLDTEK